MHEREIERLFAYSTLYKSLENVGTGILELDVGINNSCGTVVSGIVY